MRDPAPVRGPDDDHAPVAPAAPARLRDLPTRLLSLVAVHSDRRVGEQLARVGARKWHYAVLATLEHVGAASQADLSRRTGIFPSDVVAVLAELADGGLVSREPDPADRRRNVVALTDEGRRRLVELDAVLAAVQDEVLAPLTAAERRRLTALLGRLAEHHGASGPAAMA